MTIYVQTLGSIIVLGTIILLVVFLRHRGTLAMENGRLFADLVMQVTLPAIIFYALSHAALAWKYLELTGMMLLSELVVLFLVWCFAKAMQLGPKQTGSLLLVSAFGSSALLGYALIAQVFPHDAAAMAEAAFISELGVGLPLFTIGVMIAIYYGSEGRGGEEVFKSALTFFRSPIFVAIVAGSTWSITGLPLHGMVLDQFFDAVHIIGKANTLLVTLIIGVTLRFDQLKAILGILIVAVMFKLVVSPFVVVGMSHLVVLEPWQSEVLIIESAMPSAILGVALSQRYGCDTELASKLVFATLLGSAFTIVLMMRLLAE